MGGNSGGQQASMAKDAGRFLQGGLKADDGRDYLKTMIAEGQTEPSVLPPDLDCFRFFATEVWARSGLARLFCSITTSHEPRAN